MPASEDNDDQADFALEEAGYDADVDDEKTVFSENYSSSLLLTSSPSVHDPDSQAFSEHSAATVASASAPRGYVEP